MCFEKDLPFVLINNAVDALLENRVENPRIKIESIIKDENIEVCIYDNCGGIKDDIFNNIFEPYFSTKGKNGTGLGLYMSKLIIEKEMDGSLEARNRAEGAEFIIKIPLADLIPSKEENPKEA